MNVDFRVDPNQLMEKRDFDAPPLGVSTTRGFKSY